MKRKKKKLRKNINGSSAQKKCFVVTSEQLENLQKKVADSGKAVILGVAITAVSLFSDGCVSTYYKTALIIDPQELRVLAKDTDEHVRKGVAVNINTPPDVFRDLAKDKNEDVRRQVAGNGNTPFDVLRELAGDKDKCVRSAVRNNSKAPYDWRMKICTYCTLGCIDCTSGCCTWGYTSGCTECTEGCTHGCMGLVPLRC